MRTYLISILLLLPFSIYAQEEIADKNDFTVLNSFIEELANPKVAPDIIISKYILVEDPSNEIYDFLEARIEEIRLNLTYKNTKDIIYTAYNELPKKETKDIDLEGLNPDGVYFLYYNKQQILGLYIKDSKIASINLVAKGNKKAHFVLY